MLDETAVWLTLVVVRVATVEVCIVDWTVVPVMVDDMAPEEVDSVVEGTFIVPVETVLESTVAPVVEVDICPVGEPKDLVIDGRYAMPRLRLTPKIMATAENASTRFEYSDKGKFPCTHLTRGILLLFFSTGKLQVLSHSYSRKL